jgi:hypothetical protein
MLFFLSKFTRNLCLLSLVICGLASAIYGNFVLINLPALCISKLLKAEEDKFLFNFHLPSFETLLVPFLSSSVL